MEAATLGCSHCSPDDGPGTEEVQEQEGKLSQQGPRINRSRSSGGSTNGSTLRLESRIGRGSAFWIFQGAGMKCEACPFSGAARPHSSILRLK